MRFNKKLNKVIVGNWKMHKTIQESQDFFKFFNDLYQKNVKKINENVIFGLAAPITCLQSIKKIIDNAKYSHNFLLAAQNVHFALEGAFTGELSIPMIKEVGANAVIIGHSERRSMFNENDQDLHKKIHVILESDLTPIVCVGETLEEYQNNKTKEIIKKSIKTIFKNIQKDDWDKIIIAYEPIWAIGTGKVATVEVVQEICQFIHSLTSEKVIVQYGGSVNVDNIANIMAKNDVNGALVGGASLKPDSFIQLLINSKKS